MQMSQLRKNKLTKLISLFRNMNKIINLLKLQFVIGNLEIFREFLDKKYLSRFERHQIFLMRGKILKPRKKSENSILKFILKVMTLQTQKYRI